jgi:ELWxxDGT repeat protein
MDINPRSAGSSLEGLTNVNGTLYFSAQDGSGQELWRSRGTTADTIPLESFALHTSPPLVNAGGTLFLLAPDGSGSTGLWKSDGSYDDLVLVRGGFGANSGQLTSVNGTVYFAGQDGTNGLELWKSDGTAAGTRLVKDIDPGTADSAPHALTNVKGTLYFVADDGSHGQELWRSDGTAAGTVLVKDINPGSADGLPQELTVLNGVLYFSADDGVHGRELWRSDGTQNGTAMVRDLNANTGSAAPQNLTNVNGTLFFSIADRAHGNELWKTDGTAVGTVLVKDINPGGGSDAFDAVVSNGLLYFAANDGAHGYELWRSDGTAGGTVLVQDINPGPSSSQLDNLTDVNGTLFFAVNDGAHGKELWKYVPSQLPLTGNGTSIQTTEGAAFRGTVAWFLDPAGTQSGAPYHAVIDWGDGTTPDAATIALVNGKFTVTGSHTYARVGSYQATITLQRGDGSSVTVRSPVTIAEAPLYAGRTFVRATTNQPFTGIVATFIDTNPLSKPGDFKATITWGDGHTSVGVIQPNAAGGFSVTGGNTYASAGMFSIIITIKEAGGITVTVQSIMRVTA